MRDVIRQAVDAALDEHAYRVRTEVLWIKGKYEDKLEVRGRMQTCMRMCGRMYVPTYGIRNVQAYSRDTHGASKDEPHA
jgi:hypothetical protein